MAASITSFIVHGNDYFAAHLEDGGVRVGLIDYQAHDFPASHAMYSRVAAVTNEAEAEALFDECFCIYGPAIVII